MADNPFTKEVQDQIDKTLEMGEALKRKLSSFAVCPCELCSAEECRICEDRKNASLIETQQELIQKLFFENQMLRQAVKALKGEENGRI